MAIAGGTMRIYCPDCEAKATIRSSENVSKRLRKLYCICSNPECGHTFSVDVVFSHTISPSARTLPERIRKQISQKSPGELATIFERLP